MKARQSTSISAQTGLISEPLSSTPCLVARGAAQPFQMLSSMSIRNDLAMALDAAAVMRCAGFVPDPWQIEYLRCEIPQILLLCSRQSGKSRATASLAAHKAFYTPGSLTLLLSPSERQSKEIFRKVKEVYNAVRPPIKPISDNKLEYEFDNGSRVAALPGKEESIRSFSGVDLLVIDEASRVDDVLYRSVRPMLAVSNGQLVCLTTPWGKRGWFYDAWEHGGSEWWRKKLTYKECPRITDKFVEGERKAMPDWFIRQEYFVEFVDTEDSVFSHDIVHAAIDDDLEPLFAEAA